MISFKTIRGSAIEIETVTEYRVKVVCVAINGKPTHDTFELAQVDGLGFCLRGRLQSAAGVTTIPVPADKIEAVRAEIESAKVANKASGEKARAFDRTVNEGGYGYNPYR